MSRSEIMITLRWTFDYETNCSFAFSKCIVVGEQFGLMRFFLSNSTIEQSQERNDH